MIHHNKRYIILPFNDLKKYSTTLPLKDYLTIKIPTNIFQIHYTTTNTKNTSTIIYCLQKNKHNNHTNPK